MSKRKLPVDLSTKVEILKQAEKKLKSNAQLAKDFNMPRTTLQTILKQKDKILEAHNEKKFGEKRKKLRHSTWPEVEDALELWMKKVRVNNLNVSGPILKAKAEDFALKLGHDDFKASDGWLTGFKTRRQIVAKKINGESSSADQPACDSWLKETWPKLVKEYTEENIFNADETGLYWRQLPERTLAFKDDKAKGEKKDKRRITVLVGANLSGTEKLPMLVIGKAAKPRCFKGIQRLPVDYVSNKNAWMTDAIFRNWVYKIDGKFAHKNRKVVLLLDNCTAHGDIPDLKAVRLEFLPSNTTSILQPMDQGVIRNLKVHYQKKVLYRILACLDNDKQYDLDLLKALYILASSWDDVQPKTLAGSFRKGGLLYNAEEIAVPIAEVAAEKETEDLTVGLMLLKERGIDVLGESNVEGFIQTDCDLQVCEELSEEGIVSSIVNNRKKNQSVAQEVPDEELFSDPTPILTISEARSSIDNLHRFF